MTEARWPALLIAAAMTLPPAGSIAQEVETTAAEMSLLPTYCPDTMYFIKGTYTAYPPNVRRWRDGLIGPDFDTLHHYCRGLLTLMRTDSLATMNATRQQRDFSLNAAISDFDFVIKKSSPRLKLLPEIFVAKGQVLARLHRDKEAVDSYRRAIAAKQDYWPAYARWAELLQNRGNIAQARSVVGEGMKHSPESKTLNALQAELGVAEKKSKAAGKAKAESTDAAESKSEGEK